MRDRFKLNERLFALYYPPLAELAERAGQRETRRRLLAAARGRTLELGAGSGLNLPHYTARVDELVLTEPGEDMLARLRAAVAAAPTRAGATRVLAAQAESLPFADDEFDTVVASFVLCTVEDPEGSLREIARVLRPGGALLFLEHVHAGEGTLLGRLQDLVEAPHRYLAAGCHPNRRTERLLQRSPLELERLEHGRQPRSVPTVRPTITGWARAPG